MASTISDPNQLFDLIGSFWQNYLADVDVLVTQEWANLQLHADVYLRVIEQAAALAVQQVQPFLAQQWQLVRLLQSELSQSLNVIQYGSGIGYGDGHVYGQIRSNAYTWQLDTQLKDIGYLVDQVINPQVVFDSSNSYFDPQTSTISFVVNPFTLMNSLPVYDGAGNVIDQQILLWARNASLDIQTPWLRYGSILKIPGQSNADYVEILQASWSLFVNGPNLHDLTRGFMASAGLRATAGTEVVQVVQTDVDGLCIVTDQNVYRFAPTATPLVTVGQTVIQDQALADTVQVIEFGTGRAPDYAAMPGIALGPGLVDGVLNMIVWPNNVQNWQYVNGDAQVVLYGDPTDIANFWAATHVRGVASGRTLAQWLGVTSIHTFAVNPMEFIIGNTLANSLIVITVKPQDFLDYQTGFLNRLASLVPSGTILLVQMDISAVVDSYQASGVASSAMLYPAIVPTVDSISSPSHYTDGTPLVLVY